MSTVYAHLQNVKLSRKQQKQKGMASKEEDPGYITVKEHETEFLKNVDSPNLLSYLNKFFDGNDREEINSHNLREKKNEVFLQKFYDRYSPELFDVLVKALEGQKY